MVDVSEELPSLHRREGLNQWKVFTGDGSKEYNSYQQYREDTPIHSNNNNNKNNKDTNTSYNKNDSNNNLNNSNSSKKRKMEPQPNKPKSISIDNDKDSNNASSPPTQNQRTVDLCESMFPPLSSEENISKQLKRCVRIYPHLQDSGGFFVAMLRKSIANPNKNNNNNKSNSVNKGKNKNSNNNNNNNNTSTTKNTQQDNKLPNGVGEYSAKEMQIKQHRFPLNQRYSQSIYRYISISLSSIYLPISLYL